MIARTFGIRSFLNKNFGAELFGGIGAFIGLVQLTGPNPEIAGFVAVGLGIMFGFVGHVLDACMI